MGTEASPSGRSRTRERRRSAPPIAPRRRPHAHAHPREIASRTYLLTPRAGPRPRLRTQCAPWIDGRCVRLCNVYIRIECMPRGMREATSIALFNCSTTFALRGDRLASPRGGGEGEGEGCPGELGLARPGSERGRFSFICAYWQAPLAVSLRGAARAARVPVRTGLLTAVDVDERWT